MTRALSLRRLAALACLPLALLLPACAGVAAPPLEVYQSLGSRQCERGGRTPAELAELLRAAGVPVQAVGCGHDGRMRPMVCGAADGRIAIIAIPAEQLATAEQLGFWPLSALPDARRLPCPAEPVR